MHIQRRMLKVNSNQVHALAKKNRNRALALIHFHKKRTVLCKRHMVIVARAKSQRVR